KLAAQIITIETRRTEIGVESLAINDRGFRCVGVGGMRGDGGLVLGRGLFPEDFTRGSIEAVDLPVIDRVRRLAAAKHATRSTRTTRPAAARRSTRHAAIASASRS